MNAMTHLKHIILPILVAILLGCFALLPEARGVVPAPDGGYPGGNTAEGQKALFSLTTGTYNTAVGFLSLSTNTEGEFNTAVGAGALLVNTSGTNTATGAWALLSNSTGAQNTADGGFALFSNTTGTHETATGAFALRSNTTGNENTAIGNAALYSNTDGSQNTATGVSALFNNVVGSINTACGDHALFNNLVGNGNTAIGGNALGNNTGSGNTAIGYLAGMNQTSGNDNVYIGFGAAGVAGESNGCYIASIFGQTSVDGVQVLVNSSNKLGTMTSSKRFKQDIKPMDKVSTALYALKPVTFRYKKEIDPVGTSQLGLVAEDVEKVNPDLVVHDKVGKPYSVRYDQVNAMLLNEFLKEHRTVQELKSNAAKQQATIARQQKQIEALTAGLEKVGAQIELTKPAP